MPRTALFPLLVSLFCLSWIGVCGGGAPLAADEPQGQVGENRWSLASPELQEDDPDLCLDANGRPWIVYLAHDGAADRLKLARVEGEAIVPVADLAGPGILHQPRLTADGADGLWAVWSELEGPINGAADGATWNLYAQRIADGKPTGKRNKVAAAAGNNVFADAACDAGGRLWVAWQAFRGGPSGVFARHREPESGRWSAEMQVSDGPAGAWQPRLAVTRGGGAHVVYDAAQPAGGYDVTLARVAADGKIARTPLGDSPAYEACGVVAAAPDGERLWVAWELGLPRWGLDRRTHGANLGLNANKQVEVVLVDAEGNTLERLPDVKPLIARLAAARPAAGKRNTAAGKKKPAAGKNKNKPAAGKQNTPAAKGPAQAGAKKQPAAKAKGAKPKTSKDGVTRVPRSISLNRPQLVADDGGVWLAVRYAAGDGIWRLALARYDRGQKRWSAALPMVPSAFCQDRLCRGRRDAEGNVWWVWPADRRTSKQARVAGVELARHAADIRLTYDTPTDPVTKPVAPPRTDPARDTPMRSRDERHTWAHDGQRRGLYFGDFHRHTDFSNCRTITDGSIVEQFRYACDQGQLDFLGTSDHTDIAKAYSPYEWWQNQKLADLFQVPGFFNSFYVYEREQKWPWGHRNVVFAERGGPIVYIKRANYLKSPWQKEWPVGDGPAEISPQELWNVLKASGKQVTVVSHTGATGMGTDWDLYDQIDGAVENLVEIYQSARVSYEGVDTPQPTVGVQLGARFNQGTHDPLRQTVNFGKHKNGVYQNALANGHRLGVFASSDHISTNAAYGGVYAESFTRAGILEGLQARRTIGATDKIFLEFECNGRMLGSIFETDRHPELTVRVEGTAPIVRVTLVRNERDYKTFTPGTDERAFSVTYTDPEPLAGENRYYVRIEQTDGNMAWASPVWATFKP